MSVVRRVLVLLSVVAAGVVVPSNASAVATVAPGDAIFTNTGACTLGFLADGTADGRTGPYFLTAAHCVNTVGDSVRLIDESFLGRVVAIGNPHATESDWALIEVPAGRTVTAAVRGHGPPTGSTTIDSTSFGDLLQYSGHGIPWSAAAPLREQRIGVLTGDEQEAWYSIGPDSFGDSGGPVLHQSTGRALGLVSRLCVGTCTSAGPTIEGILPQTAAQGFPIELRTS